MILRMLLSLVMAVGPLRLAWAEDWPQWRGPERTGVSKEKGLLLSWPVQGPKLLWTFRAAGAGFSSMSVVGDRLYSMGAEGDKEYVYAINLKTQKKLWSVAVGARWVDNEGDGPRSTPTVDGSFLYALGAHGDLVCVELSSGRKAWSQGLKAGLDGRPSPYGYSESLLVDGDLVVAAPGGDDGAIAAFNKKSGTLKWRSTDTNEAGYSSMIAIEVCGTRQYVKLTRSDGAVGVRASDGKLLWEFFPLSGINTPIYQSNCVYLSGYGGSSLLKLIPDGDKFKVEQIYTDQEMGSAYGSVILVGAYLYGYCSKYGWMCQDFKTGKIVWKKNPKAFRGGSFHPGMGKGSVVYADGNLYGYHENKGDVLLLKATPEGYQERGRFRIPEETKLPRKLGRIYTHPVVANGKLYLRDQDLIFCYDIRKPQ